LKRNGKLDGEKFLIINLCPYQFICGLEK
jgi:hypothetical protein